MTHTDDSHRSVARRLARLDWPHIERDLDEQGWSRLPQLLSATKCASLIRAYSRKELFRSTIDMERYRFGKGQYRYFAYPLPPLIAALRAATYPRLSTVANRWAARLGRASEFPEQLEPFLAQCHRASQTRPTPLLLRYGAGDYNCLHQDVYGAIGFPLQILVVLSQRGADYDGGEVVLVEQRPRSQAKATVVGLERGDALIFTNRDRPERGRRGFYAVPMRHGASAITRGHRFVLGIIFHDAA
jgi:uncharacterized protein